MIPRLVSTAVFGVALAALAGCSSGSPETSASSPSTAPAASRALSDFTDDPGQYSFRTPSGQIQCQVQDAGLACQTQGHPHTVAESALCGFYPGEEQGRATRFGFLEQKPTPCATIIQGDGYDSPHTLAYGESVSVDLSSGRTVTCTSAIDGLTCARAGGNGPRGFFLSVDSFTVF